MHRVKRVKAKRELAFTKDRRRKHKHFQVTVFYRDGEKFARVYTDRKKAEAFAIRQRRSPIIKSAKVELVN
jgi:hypothetical protein